KGLIAIDKATQATGMRGVFAGGDAANGPATVVEAIAAGRRAAISIDRYLGGDGTLEFAQRKAEDENGQPPYDGKRESGFAELPKVAVPSLPLSERNNGFAEVERCYSDEQVRQEIHRCLQCDLEIRLARETRCQLDDA
ncbi:MAG: hypothetical protein JSW39_11590, partial [Desulfobacterales bacterium]